MSKSINNSWNSDAFISYLTVAPVDAEVRETHDETGKNEPEVDRSISYAGLTMIQIDQETRTRAQSFDEKKVLARLSISVLEARSINLNAKTEIIKLSSKMVEKFPVDRTIRKRLEQLENLARPSIELGYTASYLSFLKLGRTQTISKKRADEYNEYFSQKDLRGCSEIFDLERIFQLAMKELISQNDKKLCEKVFIKFNGEQREQLKELSESLRKGAFYKKKIRELTRNPREDVSVKDAVIIRKLSGKMVFNFSGKAVVQFPVLPEQLKELKNNNELTEIQSVIYSLADTDQPNITSELAEMINSYLGKTIFDVELILAQSVQEAEAEAESIVPSFSRKRSSSDISPTSEDLSEPSPKKQRKADKGVKAASLPSTFDEHEAALSLVMLAKSSGLDNQRLEHISNASSMKRRTADENINPAMFRLPSFAELDVSLSSVKWEQTPVYWITGSRTIEHFF